MAQEPQDFSWIRAANLAQLRNGLIQAEEQGNEAMAAAIRKKMNEINKAKQSRPTIPGRQTKKGGKGKSLLTVG